MTRIADSDRGAGPASLATADLPPLETVDLIPLDRCNLCGGAERDRLISTRHWTSHIEGPRPIHAVVCRGCGLIHLTQTLPPEILEHPSKHGGALTYGEVPTDEVCDRHFHRQLRRGEKTLDYLRRFVGDFRGRRALDLHCEAGGVTAALRDAGAEAEALEPSVMLSAYARHRHGLTVHRDLLKDFEPAERYDLITALRVLNHYLDPSAVLAKVRELLAPGGVLFMELLNFPHALSRKPLRSCMHVDHPYMFTPASLRAYLAKAGFEVLALETDLEGGHDFGSLNHVHVTARAAEDAGGAGGAGRFEPSAEAAIDAKLACLSAMAQFFSDRLEKLE